MQAKKTHEQQLRILERKEDVPKFGDAATLHGGPPDVSKVPRHPEARQDEFAVSSGGMHQESRQHNKHNNPGQSGHKPQKHTPDEEGH